MTTAAWFISFEGGDGCGKSTQSRMLGRWLGAATGKEVVLTREPGGTELGRELRAMVLHGGDLAPRVEALLYATDRAHHVATVVRPALDRGAVVVTDRYLDSSVAYQAGGRRLAAQEVENLSRWAVEDLIPHVTVLLDLAPEVGMSRIEGALDRLESSGADFHRRTRDAYLAMAAAAPERWVVVDAAGSPEQVHDAVRTAVAARLGISATAGTTSDGVHP